MTSSYCSTSGRRKAVWGPKRTVSALLLIFACATPNLAFAKPHGHPTRKVPGAPGYLVKNYKVDDQIGKHAKGSTTRVIVTLVPGATLPPEFKKYSLGTKL